MNRTLWVACRLIAEYFFQTRVYVLDAIHAFSWLPPSVSRVTGPGRLQGRALEHGLVAALSRLATTAKGIRMKHRDGTLFFIDDSKEARQILTVMTSVATRLCKSMGQEMRSETARSELSRRALALAIQFCFSAV